MTLEFYRGDANRPWRWMLSIDAVIAALAFLYQIFFHVPLLQYSFLLTTYHFGFVRRALVGSIIALFTDHVPISLVSILGIVIWLVTVALFVTAFRKTFGLTQKTFALFVFVIGSPFFFKNFMISLGYFDIYGCAWALVALLIGTGPLYPLIITAGCVVLILMHHLHFLLYVPTIGFIVALRYGLSPRLSAGKVAYGASLAVLLAAVFVACNFFGRMPVPADTYLAYVAARATRPINPEWTWTWYATLSQELALTRFHFVKNALRLPVYAACDRPPHSGGALYRHTHRRPADAPPSRRRDVGTDRHHRRLCRHFRGGVRLFALGVELGGVHVPLHDGDQARVVGSA